MGTETNEQNAVQTNIVDKLEAKIPREAVKGRSQAGQTLSYLETWYVIDKMNEIFGNLNWNSDTTFIQEISGQERPTYIARVRISVLLANGLVVFKDGMGYGSGKGGKDAHEMGVKEAESDALKRAAMKFGKALGLALYDKTQENVEDAKPVATKAAAKSAVSGVAASRVPSNAKGDVAPVQSGNDDTLALITQLAKVADAKKKLPISDFKKFYQEKYKVGSTADLNVAQRTELVDHLRNLVS